MTPATLARVHAAAFTQDRPWSADEFAGLLGSRGVILCGDARSFLLGRVVADEAEVLSVATDPAHQRQGLARAALAEFEHAAREAGAARAFLEVAADNLPAKSLYLRHGFIQVAERPRYYARKTGASVAALIMQKHL